MKRSINLLEGPIYPSLTRLALPVVGTSLVQMAYNMVDMLWIGRAGAGPVAAVGAAGMYMWLSQGIATLGRMGGQVKVAHSLGADDPGFPGRMPVICLSSAFSRRAEDDQYNNYNKYNNSHIFPPLI